MREKKFCLTLTGDDGDDVREKNFNIERNEK
jgi:hypothetical protein